MKMLKLLFLLCSCIVMSQKYMPIDTADRDKREIAVSDFQQSSKIFIESVKKKYTGKESKLMTKNFEEFFKDFEEEIKEGRFCYDSRFLDYADKMLNELRKDNPEIPENTKILISKDIGLNAFCLPNGTFILNMGLFYWLENDDQLASILSHELSHKILDHSEKRQLNLIQNELSSKSKQQVKAIKRQKYNRNQAAFDVFKNMLYATGEISKRNEHEADSLGLILVKKSAFNEGAFIDALQLMERYDSIQPQGLGEEIYRKVFNLPGQPFKDEWLQKEDFSRYDYSLYKEKIDKDSIASHPELDLRIAKLKKDFPDLRKELKEFSPTKDFKKLHIIAGNEQLPSLYFLEQYGKAIYLCLLRLQDSLADKYYQEWLGKCFEKVYEGRKKYQLNRYLERLEPKEQTESYQQFLNFMWNLSLDEIRNIADYYNKNKESID